LEKLSRSTYTLYFALMHCNVETGMNFERCNVYSSPSTNISEIQFYDKKPFKGKVF